MKLSEVRRFEPNNPADPKALKSATDFFKRYAHDDNFFPGDADLETLERLLYAHETMCHEREKLGLAAVRSRWLYDTVVPAIRQKMREQGIPIPPGILHQVGVNRSWRR